MSKTFVKDAVKGSCFQKKDLLKALGFRWNAEVKRWYTEKGIDNETREKLAAEGIVPDEATESPNHGCYQMDGCIPRQTGGDRACMECGLDGTWVEPGEEDDDARQQSKPEPASPVMFYKVVQDGKFNHGAYLHSRAKSGKPIDAWYKGKLIEEPVMEVVSFLVGKYHAGASYVISAILENEWEGKKTTSAWLFFVGTDDIIIDRAKIRIEKKVEKK